MMILILMTIHTFIIDELVADRRHMAGAASFFLTLTDSSEDSLAVTQDYGISI